MTNQPKTAAYYCVYDDDEWLPCSVASIYEAVDAIYFFVSDVPWNGEKTGNEQTLSCIRALPDPEKKIQVVTGNWDDQVTQRNFATARLSVDGFDYAFIIDADEIYNSEHLKNMLAHAYEKPEVGCWHALFLIFWKSHKYRIDPPEEHHPPILMRIGSGAYVEYRNPVCDVHDLIPPTLGLCFHMSYARTDEQIRRKITSCSFSPLVREDWYEKTWKAWDTDHSITDLCPYNPGVFERAVEVPFDALPKALQDFVSSKDTGLKETGESQVLKSKAQISNDKLKINISCSLPVWIYGTFIEEIKRNSKHDIRVNDSSGSPDITHYLPYYEVPEQVSGKTTAFFSHQELAHQNASLTERFLRAGKQVDWAICMAKKYETLLRSSGVERITQIVPGVDSEKFLLRKERGTRAKKLRVGFIGQEYSTTPRKNPTLLATIAELPFVELRTTGGKIPTEEIPAFYADLDVVVSPATVEGGPMALLEALAVGVPFICYEDVGFADEFKEGVFRCPFNDSGNFLGALETFWRYQLEQYTDPELMGKMRAQVEQYTWKNFAKAHDSVWEQVAEAGR